jgi:mannose-6-phosphate isomerase-like protein (cupin superfamily)
MSERPEYALHMDARYGYLEKIEVPRLVDGVTDRWYNQTLCKVNASVLRLGVFEGEFHLHVHDRDDEVFFVLDGELLIETEKGDFVLQKNEGVCIPRGTLHRPVARRRTVVLMMENEGMRPTGD